jgi:hypothetical protein
MSIRFRPTLPRYSQLLDIGSNQLPTFGDSSFWWTNLGCVSGTRILLPRLVRWSSPLWLELGTLGEAADVFSCRTGYRSPSSGSGYRFNLILSLSRRTSRRLRFGLPSKPVSSFRTWTYASRSTLYWQLTVLFRGLNRPSSPACPKASISCPESLIKFHFSDIWRFNSVDSRLLHLDHSSPIRRSLKLKCTFFQSYSSISVQSRFKVHLFGFNRFSVRYIHYIFLRVPDFLCFSA